MWPSINYTSVYMNSVSVFGMSLMCLAHARAPLEITKDIECPGPAMWETGLTPMRLFNATTGFAECKYHIKRQKQTEQCYYVCQRKWMFSRGSTFSPSLITAHAFL